MKRISISVINDLVTDQRVRRMIGTLLKEDSEVFLIGRLLPNSLPMPDVSYRYKRLRRGFRKGPLFYAFFNTRLFFILLFKKRPDLLISNDLDTLLANFLVSKIRRIPVLYDSHEYFTEVPELIHRPATKKVWERIEGRILPKLTYAITVSDSIAAEYSKKYATKFRVVRNLSEARIPESDPAFHDHYPSRYKLIYQGALNLGRGLELLINSMQWMQDTMLLIAGDGDIRIDLQKLVQELKVTDKVIFLGKMPPQMLHKITSQCDLGISLEEDLGLNYRMALPNKIFDYIQARIPVLCSDLPEMRNLVEKYQVGEIVRDREPGKISSQILEILKNQQNRSKWDENLDIAALELCWENEEKKLVEILNKIWE